MHLDLKKAVMVMHSTHMRDSTVNHTVLEAIMMMSWSLTMKMHIVKRLKPDQAMTTMIHIMRIIMDMAVMKKMVLTNSDLEYLE